MDINWKHKKTIYDRDRFVINGLNIWDFKWRNTGERINIKDPLYGQPYSFIVYEIVNGNIKVVFAAGEFSNLVWGIYQQE